MSRSESPERVRESHVAILGETLGSVYHELYDQFYWLQIKWQEYVELFGTNPERINLLNEAAPSFFHIVQDALWDDLLIHISLLTDSPRSRGKENLTFAALPDLIDGELKAEIRQLVDRAVDSAGFARDWRNRRIAHHDLQLALGATAEPLSPASRSAVKETLAALHAVLGRISAHYFDSYLEQRVVGSGRGAESLLYVLYDGVAVYRDRLERIGSGDFRPEDLQLPSL